LVDAYVRAVSHVVTLLEGAYCNALLFAYWSVRQSQTTSVQFSSVHLGRSVRDFAAFCPNLLSLSYQYFTPLRESEIISRMDKRENDYSWLLIVT